MNKATYILAYFSTSICGKLAFTFFRDDADDGGLVLLGRAFCGFLGANPYFVNNPKNPEKIIIEFKNEKIKRVFPMSLNKRKSEISEKVKKQRETKAKIRKNGK